MPTWSVVLMGVLVLLALVGLAVGIAYAVFQRDYHERQGRLRAMPQDQRLGQLRQLFRITNEGLRAHNVHPFPVYGTLLGLQRGDDIIPWDYDVDFAVVRDEWESAKAALAAIQHDNPGLHVNVQRVAWHEVIHLELPNGLHADVLMYTGREAVPFNVLIPFFAPHEYMHCKREWFEPMAERDTALGTVCWPRQSEKLLARWYGDHWAVPDREA